MSNTELIAELRDTASKGVSVWGDLQKEAADAIAALEAENASITNDALKFVAERDALQAQLAAAQGQEPVAWIEWDTNLNEGDPDSITAGCDMPDLACDGWEWRPLCLAAPIPQQPSVPEGWKLVPIEPTHLQAKAAADAWLGCDSKLYLNKAMAAAKAVLAAAPQPKETK